MAVDWIDHFDGVKRTDPLVAGLVGVVSAGVFISVGLYLFAKGLDKTYSLANLQVILWTGVILGSYLSMALLKGVFLRARFTRWMR